VKLTVVCAIFVSLLLGCVALGLAQEASPWSGESADVQRLFKFSGTLTDSHRTGFVGGVSVRFTMYDQPDGGEPYWQETQNVRPDARGRYTVLLGETTLGGLPAEIFVSRGRHWLEVRASGQPEQARILLVELPSRWKPDPISSSAPVSKRTILPSDPTERRLALILLIMFLGGTAMAYGEVVKWWKTRAELYGEPPLTDPFNSVPGPDKTGHSAEMLRFPLAEKFRSIRGRFQHLIQSMDSDRPNKAA
jgi:hypothetical protein